MRDDGSTVRTDLVVEDIDIHPEEKKHLEEAIRQFDEGGQMFVLPADADPEKRRLFEAVVDVCGTWADE